MTSTNLGREHRVLRPPGAPLQHQGELEAVKHSVMGLFTEEAERDLGPTRPRYGGTEVVESHSQGGHAVNCQDEIAPVRVVMTSVVRMTLIEVVVVMTTCISRAGKGRKY